MKYLSAIEQAGRNKVARRYPARSDSRSRVGTVFPYCKPKFDLAFTANQTIFTIGSCFARNIEEALFETDVFLPTRMFKVPKEEWPHRPNGLLNEYNPGAIAQRIAFALDDKELPEETVVPSGDSYSDLTLPGGSDVTIERAFQRRKQINDVYKHLRKSHAVIITLGFVEAWFDEETKIFLNRAPPHAFGKKFPSRFTLKRLNVSDVISLLAKPINSLTELGIKVVLTVSPVPLQATFTASDCVIANEFSKSVLRVSIDNLIANPLVDYYPSYEIVRSGGMGAFEIDQVHVRSALVNEITKYMVAIYQGKPATVDHS